MIRRLREAVLWAGAVLGLLAVLTGVAVAFLGVGFLIFRSGSMGPDIPTGSLALERTVRADQIHHGDVVSVVASNGARVTHRVVTTTLRGDTVTLTLKGDANGTPDAETYDVRHADRVVVSVPYAGYVVSYLMSPPGLAIAVVMAGVLLILGFTGDDTPSNGDAPDRRGRRRHAEEPPATRDRRSTAAATVMSMAAGAVAATGFTGTLAYFTDPAKAATGSFTATTVASPTVSCASAGTATLTFSWPVVVVAGYTVTYTATLNSGLALTVTGTGTTRSASVTNAQAPGTILGTKSYTVSVVAVLSTAPGWKSVAGTDTFTSTGTIFLQSMSC